MNHLEQKLGMILCTEVIKSKSSNHNLQQFSYAGEMAPPLTIVLVNNGGGGIFDFLPISEEIPRDTFNQLWTTPQNVDLAG